LRGRPAWHGGLLDATQQRERTVISRRGKVNLRRKTAEIQHPRSRSSAKRAFPANYLLLTAGQLEAADARLPASCAGLLAAKV